jgi:hypothetical protein
MKVIIAGSRTINNHRIVAQAVIKSGFLVTEVVSGGANGVDRCGEWYADANKLKIKRFLAEWHKYGKKAGAIRNALMAEYADALVAVWDGVSPGTKMMIEMAEKKGLKVYVYQLGELPKILPKIKDPLLETSTEEAST